MITFAVLLLIPALLMLALYAVIHVRETTRQLRTKLQGTFWAERQARKGRKA